MQKRDMLAVHPVILLLALQAWPWALTAQFNEPPPPAAYALQGVTVVRADGSRAGGITIVVRGRFIEAMGTDVAVPEDARILEGDSLLVYPGLIDAVGKAEFKFPEQEVNREEIPSWDPPRHVQGFLPHRRLVDVLTATGQDLKSQREKGVVAAGVHPDGPLMPGRGALLLFRKEAHVPAELVVRPVIGTVFSFDRPRGVYPATHFGVMAFMRQAFEDARRDGLILDAHSRDPQGLSVPSWDPDREMLREVMSGRSPVFFEADGAENIRQVLSLAEAYGFRPVIVGGGQAWKVASLLRERQVPVLVSLDFPKPKRWKPEQEEAEEAEEPDTAAAEQEEEQEEEEEPLDPAAQREKERLENLYSNAGRLAAAGVTFALTSGGGKADLRVGARKAIEYGLGEAQALAALTSTPADLLGAPYLSRVETGMPATFIVTDGPLFEKGSDIAYTFVEGSLEEGRAKKPAEDAEAPLVDMTGTWEMEIDAEGQSMGGKMTLTQKEGEFSGTLDMEFGPVKVVDGAVSGNEVSFQLVATFGGETMEMDVTGTVEGDEASGSGSGPLGSFSWTARRIGTPPNGRVF